MSDITKLNDRIDVLMKVYTWQVLVESILRGILSLSVFFIVLVRRNRKELFLWMIPLQLIINNALNSFLAAGTLLSGSDDVDTFAIKHYVILSIANASFGVAHWIFSA